MRIVPMLIPSSNTFTRPGIPMLPKWITLHETGNTARGATALAHAKLQSNGNSRQASWHYTCGSDGIYQSLPSNEVGWHAGDNRGDGNMKSIGIEICVNEDGDFDKAKSNAIELVIYLMDKYSIPISNVVPHKHWSGKDCPHNILKSGWDKLIAEIDSKAPISLSTPPKYPGKYIRMGSRGEDVKLIQKALGGLVVDGRWGERTNARFGEFQKANGLVVDFICGPLSWAKLFN